MRGQVLVFCALLAGCSAAPAATTQRNGPPAYANLQRAFQQAGYAQMLAAYDRDIATLRQSERVKAFDAMSAQFDAASQNVRDDADGAGSGATSIAVRDVRTLHVPPPTQGVVANADAYAAALQARAQRAHDLHEQQLREKEATVAFEFERAHKQQRLALQLRLQNRAYLDPKLRGPLDAQLRALDAQEEAAVAKQRTADAADLSAFDAKVSAQNVTEVARMRADAQQHAAAAAQIASPQFGKLPATVVHPKYDANAIASNFKSAGADITARFSQLHDGDTAARRSADSEIRRLEQRRALLYEQAMSALRARADRVAAQQGLGAVYFADAPSGSVDITAEL